MVAGMIRELSTLQNLLCGQERKQKFCSFNTKNFPLYDSFFFQNIITVIISFTGGMASKVAHIHNNSLLLISFSKVG